MDLTTLGFAAGSAWLSGINLYATVFILGILQRFHYAHLPGELSYVEHTWVLAAAGALYAIQFVADKIPAVDAIWEVAHTFIRVPAGAVLAATAFANFDPKVRLLALLLGGGIALSSHTAKTATRLAVNASPEPFTNVGLSLASDAITAGGAALVASHPIVILVVVCVGVIVSILLIHVMWKIISKVLRKIFSTARRVTNRSVSTT